MRRSSKKLPRDANQRAYEIMRLSTEESDEAAPAIEEQEREQRSPISEYLSQIGRKGGLKGGRARAEKLTPEQKREISRKAALARWAKKKDS